MPTCRESGEESILSDRKCTLISMKNYLMRKPWNYVEEVRFCELMVSFKFY